MLFAALGRGRKALIGRGGGSPPLSPGFALAANQEKQFQTGEGPSGGVSETWEN